MAGLHLDFVTFLAKEDSLTLIRVTHPLSPQPNFGASFKDVSKSTLFLRHLSHDACRRLQADVQVGDRNDSHESRLMTQGPSCDDPHPHIAFLGENNRTQIRWHILIARIHHLVLTRKIDPKLKPVDAPATLPQT